MEAMGLTSTSEMGGLIRHCWCIIDPTTIIMKMGICLQCMAQLIMTVMGTTSTQDSMGITSTIH